MANAKGCLSYRSRVYFCFDLLGFNLEQICVNITIYNFPVPDEPEYGIATTINADYEGVAGEYTLGYGIDQESAIFISQETNGQPNILVPLNIIGWDQWSLRDVFTGLHFC